MIKLRQAVIVEGVYDKHRLSSIIDANIITTNGFALFKNKEKLEMIRALAKKCGIIVITDSDRAGFKIRAYLSGAIDPALVTHVYVPQVRGVERRKDKPSAQGLLGVEGLDAAVIEQALAKAGVVYEERPHRARPLTKADLFELGLSGGEGSAIIRRRLLKALDLPENLSSNAMLGIINTLFDYDEFIAALEKLPQTASEPPYNI